jgi:hypothetical protein
LGPLGNLSGPRVAENPSPAGTDEQRIQRAISMSADESIPPVHHRQPGTFWALVPVAMAIGSAAGISSLVSLTNHWPVSVWILGGLFAWTVLVSWALVRFPVPAETSARKPGRAQLACFALAAAALFGVSAGRHIEYFHRVLPQRDGR